MRAPPFEVEEVDEPVEEVWPLPPLPPSLMREPILLSKRLLGVSFSAHAGLTLALPAWRIGRAVPRAARARTVKNFMVS